MQGAARPRTNHVILARAFENVMPSYELFRDSLQKTVTSGLKVPVEFYTEDLDLDRFPTKRHEKRVVAYLRNKYSDRSIDLIIVVSFPALEFFSKYRRQLFPGTPIVFILIDKQLARSLTLGNNVTGVSGGLNYENTLDAALKLQPETRHVFVICGSSRYEKTCFPVLQKTIDRFAKQVQITYLTDMPLETLAEQTTHLPPHSIILYSSYFRDSTGQSYDLDESFARIYGSANAPVYAQFSHLMGRGIVGGYLTNMESIGTQAGQVARRILLGEEPRNIPTETLRQGKYVFDWRQLQRWNIAEADLPSGNEVLYRGPSLWKSLRWHLAGALSSAFVVFLLVLGLLADRRRRRSMESLLVERSSFEKLVYEVSGICADPAAVSVDKMLKEAFRHIGESLSVDQVQLLEFSESNQAFHLIGFWTAAGIAATNNDEPPTVVKFTWLTSSILDGDTISFSRLQDLPDEAFCAKEYFRQRGIRSAAIIPIAFGRSEIGAFIFTTLRAERLWPEEVLDQLRILAEICGNALAGRRSAMERRESEAQFQSLSESAPVMTWMSGEDKLCSYFNKNWLQFTGRTMKEELGNGWTAGVHPDDLEKCLEVYTKAFDERSNFTVEYRLRRADGEYRWIADTGVPRFAADGMFAGYIGSCLDVTELKKAQMTLQELGPRMIQAQEDERRRIARELHDGVSQRLALVAIDLEQLAQKPPRSKAGLGEEVRALWSQIQEVSTDIHRLSRLLHPSRLEVLGLVAAVRNLCQEVEERWDLKVIFKSENIPKDLQRDFALCLYRVAQESLQNVVKHSKSPRAEVSLAADLESVRMWVTDFGVGFDAVATSAHGGIGLASMYERLRAVGGDFNILSKPGRGTRIEACVPLRYRETHIGSSDSQVAGVKIDPKP
jgi:PAS domain S-box-containing protein